MVDPVGSKLQAINTVRLAPVAPAAPVAAAQPAVQDTAVRADPSTLKALSGPAAAAPPVDVERVAKIRKAIQDGNFPLVPSTIADRLLALKLEWKPNDSSDQPA